MSDATSIAELEREVTALEADTKDMKGSLQRLELSSVRVEAILATLATKAEIIAVAGRLDTLDARVSGLDKRLGTVETAASDIRREQKTDFYWLISVGGSAGLGLLVLMARSFHWIGG